MTQNLPPEIAAFDAFLNAQPKPVQIAFQYCLALVMVEDGKAELIETLPTDNGAMCRFKTVAGEVFSVAKPPINAEQEAMIIQQLRDILDEESE